MLVDAKEKSNAYGLPQLYAEIMYLREFENIAGHLHPEVDALLDQLRKLNARQQAAMARAARGELV